MTRTCRICGGDDGRYWIETPVEKYAEKTFGQLLVELTRIEVAMAQSEKFPQWLCSGCADKLESAYDFVLQARQTHELWVQKLGDSVDGDDEVKGTEALECLRETPIHLFEIEGVTIKTEELDATHQVVKADPLVRTRFVKRSIVHFSDSDDDQDDVPLRQRKITSSLCASEPAKQNVCELCNKAFRYVTNLYRHKQRDHGVLGKNGEDYEDDYYKCDQCDKTYKYVMALVKHKHSEHGASLLPSKTSRRKLPGRPSTLPEDASPSSPASTSGTSTHRSRTNNDTLVHSIIKAVELSDEDGNSSGDNYYKCDQCSKSYKYIVSLIKHKHKEHSDKQSDKQSDSEDDQPLASTSASAVASPPKPSRINRRVDGFDYHRCEPNGAKEIKCMICLRRFTKLRELRDHLQAHPTDFGFEAHGEPIERIAEGFFKTAVESTAEGLKRRIFRDLRMGVYGRYYSITNQARYEMTLDSSDTDSDGDGESDVVIRRSYSCELCDSPEARWPRKYLLHQHHRNEHTWLDAPHVCQRCDSRFLSAQLLEHHTSQLCQNTLKRFMCDKCPQRFFWRRNLRAHLVEHKSKQETYPCDQCSRSFQDKSAVTKHKLMMHRDSSMQLIPCRWCTRTFYRPALLYKHLQRHGFTGQDLPLAETLLADASKPAGPKSIQCKMCDIQFISVADLRRHISMQGHSDQPSAYMISTATGFELLLEDTDDSDEESTGRSYTCDLCDLNFRRRREMSEHQYSLHSFDKLPHSCEHCIFKTVDKHMLDQHLRTQCMNTEKKFVCSRCGYKFMWEENLTQHLATQHPKQPTVPEQQPSLRRKRRFRYQCPHCWRSFVVQPSLEKHIRDMHVAKKNPGKKYLCSLCGLESLTPNKLNIHMRRHMGEKPFKCDLCDMRFTVHYELKVHRRKHTGERPYQCTFCAKDFARPDKLRRHVFIHNAKS
ncbi:zinc finger protein 420 isoform X1 [Drosophila suzukii]|uniref:Zinc finger protein 420 isoform X1 n=2 Tax=Drosophila suzukii TaxID=28584 RepID=A0AB40DCH2_DROSZ